MRIGILADVHEDLSHLRWAIDVLREHRSDRLVILGDIFELGRFATTTFDSLRGYLNVHYVGACSPSLRIFEMG